MMKKIGTQVTMITTDEKNPRNGEGSFIRLKDGRIMYAFTQYCSEDWTDHASARIVAIYSSDEGRTFGEQSVLIEKREEQMNIMSVSLLRLANGDLGIFYLEKSLRGGDIICDPIFRRSSDEGKTFGEEIRPVVNKGYNGLVNDRVTRLSSGRIIIAVGVKPPLPLGDEALRGTVGAFYSDDDGESWVQPSEIVTSPYDDNNRLYEPGIIELPDGRLWLYMRTAYGCQYQSFSSDGGKSWSTPVPNWRFTTPDSPMLIKHVGDVTVAIFNPVSFSCVNDRREVWGSPKRTPFVLSVSRDGGLSLSDMSYTWRDGGYDDFVKNTYLLEDDPSNSYCYPAVIEVEGGFLVAYYHSNGSDVCLNATKIIRVGYDEID